ELAQSAVIMLQEGGLRRRAKPNGKREDFIFTTIGASIRLRQTGGPAMPVDRAWVERNLGFDPIGTPPPASAFATQAAAKPSATVEDLQREIIDFDSEGPEGAAFFAFSKATGLSRFTDIKWPAGLAPQTGKAPAGADAKLPEAKALVVP